MFVNQSLLFKIGILFMLTSSLADISCNFESSSCNWLSVGKLDHSDGVLTANGDWQRPAEATDPNNEEDFRGDKYDTKNAFNFSTLINYFPLYLAMLMLFIIYLVPDLEFIFFMSLSRPLLLKNVTRMSYRNSKL